MKDSSTASTGAIAVPCLMLVLALGMMSGCGDSSRGSVQGTVTLDGAPLPHATVAFEPKGEGTSPSYGITDEQGNYELQASRNVSGANVGEYSVTIRSFTEGDPDAEPPIPASPEKVPARYNAQTELNATVTSGSNTIDFDLESGGAIVRPNEERDEPLELDPC